MGASPSEGQSYSPTHSATHERSCAGWCLLVSARCYCVATSTLLHPCSPQGLHGCCCFCFCTERKCGQNVGYGIRIALKPGGQLRIYGCLRGTGAVHNVQDFIAQFQVFEAPQAGRESKTETGWPKKKTALHSKTNNGQRKTTPKYRSAAFQRRSRTGQKQKRAA